MNRIVTNSKIRICGGTMIALRAGLRRPGALASCQLLGGVRNFRKEKRSSDALNRGESKDVLNDRSKKAEFMLHLMTEAP